MILRQEGYDAYCAARAPDILAETSFASLHWPSRTMQDRPYRLLSVEGGMTNAFFHLIDPGRGVYVGDQQNQKFQRPQPGFTDGNGGDVRLPDSIVSHPGSALVMGGMSNHWHFLVNFVPRLELVRRRMADVFARVDRVVVHDAPDHQRRFLARLHPDVEFVHLPATRAAAHRFDRLYYVDFPKNLFLSRDMLGMTRARVFDRFDAPEDVPERIFVDRDPDVPRRRLADRAAALEILERHGVAPMFCEHHDFVGQIARFRGARFVSGLHGAGMSNMLFCAPGTPVLILDYKWPSEMYGLAVTLDLKPFLLKAAQVPAKGVAPRLQDLRVGRVQLDAALDAMLRLA